ncbi:hypothetical protein ACM1RC_22675, partial [Paenibacillus azoreducens]|uniref:hypothetical protein n=1 Tax=Paenibacillus azoreducens TaxID=116718 RepID=UPI0039F56DB0
SIQTVVMNPTISRFGFVAETFISLVVQFSKIKIFHFSLPPFISAATFIIYHVRLIFASFFLKFIF